MNRIKLHQDYLGFRLYLIGEDGFARDRNDRYVVHVLVSEIGSPHIHTIRIPNCFAWTSNEAEKLSWEHGMRLIDQWRTPIPKPQGLGADLLALSRKKPQGESGKIA